MRKSHFFSVLSLFLLVPASITWAQKITQEKGLTTINFDFPQGKIKIYLPDDIRSGDHISGSFKIEPAGSNSKQQQKATDELLKKQLKTGDPADPNLVATSLLSRGGVIAPGKVGPQFSVTITDGNNVLPVQLGVKPAQPANTGPTGCSSPSHVLAGSPLRITGPFDGDASNTKCIMGQPLRIIAESPRSCFAAIPEDAMGSQTMQVSESGKETCTQRISAVKLEVSAPKTNLRKGEKTTISVEITGLQNLPDTAVLTLDNRSTGTVMLKPSDRMTVAVLPDSTRGGVFNRQFDVQSIATGNFTISINLELPEPGNQNQYGIFCDDKCSPVGKETDATVGEVGISSSETSSPDAEDLAFKTAKWVVNNGDLFGATGNEDAALDALVKIGRTRGYVVWVKLCWKRCEKGFFCNDWETYCGPWIPVVWVTGLQNEGDNTFKATGGKTSDGEGKVEGLTRKEILELAIKQGNKLRMKK